MLLRGLFMSLMCLFLNACMQPPVPLSQQATNICTRNGYFIGTANYNQCFNSTYSTLTNARIAQQRVAARNAAAGLEMLKPAPVIYPTQSCYWNGTRNVCN